VFIKICSSVSNVTKPEKKEDT